MGLLATPSFATAADLGASPPPASRAQRTCRGGCHDGCCGRPRRDGQTGDDFGHRRLRADIAGEHNVRHALQTGREMAAQQRATGRGAQKGERGRGGGGPRSGCMARVPTAARRAPLAQAPSLTWPPWRRSPCRRMLCRPWQVESAAASAQGVWAHTQQQAALACRRSNQLFIY